jgi:hypothetical protein
MHRPRSIRARPSKKFSKEFETDWLGGSLHPAFADASAGATSLVPGWFQDDRHRRSGVCRDFGSVFGLVDRWVVGLVWGRWIARMRTRFVDGRSRRVLAVALVLSVGAVALFAGSAWSAPPRPPIVTTGGVSNVTYSSAILYGYVDARGEVTNYVFQYGPTGAYGGQSPLAPAGNGTVSIKVSQAVTGLQPGIVYHYRVVAYGPGGYVQDAEGPFVGPDRRGA